MRKIMCIFYAFRSVTNMGVETTHIYTSRSFSKRE